MSLDKLPSISVGSVHLRRDTLDLHVLWRRPDVRLERTAQRLLRLYQGFLFLSLDRVFSIIGIYLVGRWNMKEEIM